jgi:hypothetical protein
MTLGFEEQKYPHSANGVRIDRKRVHVLLFSGNQPLNVTPVVLAGDV